MRTRRISRNVRGWGRVHGEVRQRRRGLWREKESDPRKGGETSRVSASEGKSDDPGLGNFDLSLKR